MGRVFKDEPGACRDIAQFERNRLKLWEATGDTDPVTAAEARAAEILREAEAHAEARQKDAYAQGLQEGREAGRRTFLEGIESAAEAFEAVAEQFRAVRQAYLDGAEPQVVALALEVARRILRREALADPDLVRTMVRAALDELLDRQHVTILVHPEDLGAVRSEKAALIERFEEIGRMDVVPDESIPRGGCIARSRSEEIDARLDAQLDRLAELIREDP